MKAAARATAALSSRPPKRLKTDQGAEPVRPSSAPTMWRPQGAVLRLGLILTSMAVIGGGWSFYRDYANDKARHESLPPAAAQSPAAPPAESVPAPPSKPGQAPRDTARGAAAAEMVQAPPGTPLALAGADPGLLRALADRAIAAYGAGSSEAERTQAAHRIQIAAVLGYGPARALIVRDYPRSPAVRAAVPPPDATRYALDIFTSEGSRPVNTEQPFIVLASYFAESNGLATFAAGLVQAIRDDRRLQSSAALDRVLKSLAAVPEACMALAREVSATAAAAGCPTSIRDRIISRMRAAGLAGREDDARRNALRELDRIRSER